MAGEADKAVPPAPLPQDKGRWRVAPAPDGRGTPDEHKPTPPHRLRWFWITLAVLLAINWIAVLMAQSSGQTRVKVPFSPYFLQQVDAGHVKSISSRGDTIKGTFARKVVYPPNSKTAKPTSLFSTEVPTFWDNASLTAQLQEKGVEVNAKNPSSGTSLWGEFLLGFGPTLLFIGLLWYFARRAQSGAGGLGGLGTFGRSQARRVDPTKIRVTFDEVAGIDEA
jgi:cell division protease FtsH